MTHDVAMASVRAELVEVTADRDALRAQVDGRAAASKAERSGFDSRLGYPFRVSRKLADLGTLVVTTNAKGDKLVVCGR